jgi:hypothetical protein
MPLSPSLVLIVSSMLAIAVAFTLMLVGALWARVRAMPLEETTRTVTDLARRQESIEALLIQLERDREHGLAATLSTISLDRNSATTEGRPLAPQRADRAKASAVGGPTLIVVPSLAARVPGGSAAAAAELGERFGAIWALADAGETPEAITRITGHPIGQVELILGLRRQLTPQAGERA